MHSEKQRCSGENQKGWQHGEEQCVVRKIAGEVVGVPVGGEALDAPEGIRGEAGHEAQRQPDDAEHGEMATDEK